MSISVALFQTKKKCSESYEQKKQWSKKEFDYGYVFKRINERAKVFIEYGPAEKAWVPVTAPNFLIMNCFWVSGKYKGNGHGKALLQNAIEDAKTQGKDGLVTVVGANGKHVVIQQMALLVVAGCFFWKKETNESLPMIIPTFLLVLFLGASLS